ncbi:MAG: translation initiation factor IF-6 [Thermofilaceae archaeon]|nr:translation initiation factor IF-6 [Thermofilaceae archaeon]MCX8180707.1 translation initiation factor IF-6 [Thermofilaceae archaeon]MDW8003811.1 translation initiation factor IF-6 [Thermofilaceae archaeon]
MSVEITYAFGNPNLGVYLAVSDSIALIPWEAPDKLEQTLKRNLNVEIVRTSINNSPLLGILCVMNSKGILLGNLSREEEVSHTRKSVGDRMVVEVLEDVRENALGNLILANNKGAIVSPLIPRHALQKIVDALDVEVVQANLGHSTLVGALGVANDRGLLLSPVVNDDEVNFAARILKVSKSGIGTVNRGNIFIKSGIVANSKGALVGFETTGIELVRIQATLF